MTIFKELLPNDNVFYWLGSFDNTQINNVLILAGGELLILKAIRRINLNLEKTRNDLLNMDIKDFIDSYDLIEYLSIIKDFVNEIKINKENYEKKIEEIIKDAKEGVKNELYPPYSGTIKMHKNYIELYKDMIKKYLQNIHSTKDIKDIIKICEEKIQMIKK